MIDQTKHVPHEDQSLYSGLGHIYQYFVKYELKKLIQMYNVSIVKGENSMSLYNRRNKKDTFLDSDRYIIA